SNRILVVEDELEIRALARMILEAEGYEVLEAQTGEKAMEHLEKTPPDLILLDIRLPGMDGWEVLRHIAEDSRFKDIPVAIMSAHSSPHTVERAKTNGAADYLIKPFMYDELIGIVRRFLPNGK